MNFQISRDENGKPYHVSTDDGYCMTSRAFDPDRDGWMENQLDPRDFPAIQFGRDTALLVQEVNRLRRENFNLKNESNLYRKAAGFP